MNLDDETLMEFEDILEELQSLYDIETSSFLDVMGAVNQQKRINKKERLKLEEENKCTYMINIEYMKALLDTVDFTIHKEIGYNWTPIQDKILMGYDIEYHLETGLLKKI